MSNCGHNPPPGSAFCEVCGAAQAVIRCRCGQACSSGAHYCRSCGQVLADAIVSEVLGAQPAITLSSILALLPANESITLSSPAKVTQDDIADMVKALSKRDIRKRKKRDPD